MTPQDPRNRAAAAVAAVLPRSVKVRPARKAGVLLVGGKALTVAWAGEGSLGDARAVLASPSAPDVVAARRLSPGAREALSRAGVGWVDETGAAEIVRDSIVVSRTGRPFRQAEKPARWTPAVLAVAEALLCGVRGTVAGVQDVTGLSSGSCTNALRVLTDLHLLAAAAERGPASARQIVDQDALLAAYQAAAEALRPSDSLQVGVMWRDPGAGLVDIGRRWNTIQLDWAATGAVAASVIAPYLATVTTAEVFVDVSTVVELEVAAADAGLKPIDGGRLTLRPFPTVAARRLAEPVGGLRVAPWPRVYVDLIAAGVRGEEAAEHLREGKVLPENKRSPGRRSFDRSGIPGLAPQG